jgi:hypothetical protein
MKKMLIRAMCLAMVSLASIASAADARHLYVSTLGKYGGNGGIVERFRLVKGVPVAPPDLVYRKYGGPVLVGRDGTLYAQRGRRIYVFAFGSTVPSRSIEIPNLDRICSDPGLFEPVGVDGRGYLWVFINAIVSGARSAPRAFGINDVLRIPCYGIVTYAPMAQGLATPAQSIATGWPLGQAIDDDENLYAIDGNGYFADEFANALRNPHVTRVFGNPINYAGALTADRFGNVFIVNVGNPDVIYAYRHGATGTGPSSEIILPQSTPAGGLALDGDYLYAIGASGMVNGYRAYANGAQQPLFSLPVPNALNTAVGP